MSPTNECDIIGNSFNVRSKLQEFTFLVHSSFVSDSRMILRISDESA